MQPSVHYALRVNSALHLDPQTPKICCRLFYLKFIVIVNTNEKNARKHYSRENSSLYTGDIGRVKDMEKTAEH